MKRIKKIIGILLFILTFGLATTVTVPQIGNCIDVQAATKIPTPSLVSAKSSGTTKIQVKWKKVNGASGYRIYRKNDQNAKWQSIKIIKNGNTTTYTDNNLKPGKQYFYTVKAYKAISGTNVWSKSNSKGIFAVTKLAIPQVAKVYYGHFTGTVDVSWESVDGAQYYEVLINMKNSGWKVAERTEKLTANVATTIGKAKYAVRACVKYSGKVYRSNYDKEGTVFVYETYGNPYVDYSVFDIIIPENDKIIMNTGDDYELKIICDIENLTVHDNDDSIASSEWEDATDSDYLLKIHGEGIGTTTIRIYGTKYPNIYKDITVIVGNSQSPSEGKDAFTKLKNYLILYGDTNRAGNKFLYDDSYDDEDNRWRWCVIYLEKTDQIEFMISRQASDDDNTYGELFLDSKLNSYVKYEYSIYNTDGTVEAVATLNPMTYTENTTLNFNIIENDLYSNSGVQNLANSFLSIGFDGWKELISETGITLKDLGFILL